MKNSQIAAIIALFAVVSGIVIGLVSWLVSPHLALSFAVVSIGLMISVAYWRLRKAQATTTNMARRLADQISSLHSRTGSQFTALTSQLSASSSQQANKGRTTTSESMDRARSQLMNEHLGTIYKRLEGQQALLQEILVSLDLQEESSK